MFYSKTNFSCGLSSKWNPIPKKQTKKLDDILFSLPHMLTYTLGAAVAIGGVGASYITGRYISPPSQLIGVGTVGVVSSIARMTFNDRKKKSSSDGATK